MKAPSIVFLFVLIFVAGLLAGYHVGRQPSLQSKQTMEDLLEKSDGHYWYYRNIWLPNYLAEHGFQNTGQQITAGSSRPTNR
ncbi:MAG TPA: hypothetical protein VGI03_09230 [Verrucomicrobiae bacterium]|jgi:hypothetical protein